MLGGDEGGRGIAEGNGRRGGEVELRTMTRPWKQRRSRVGGASHRRRIRREPPLCSASLGSPIFVEPWNGGSPLNWVEFMGRWERTRSDRSGDDSKR